MGKNLNGEMFSLGSMVSKNLSRLVYAGELLLLFKEKYVVVVSHIQRIGCQPEKNYFTRWPIPLVVC